MKEWQRDRGHRRLSNAQSRNSDINQNATKLVLSDHQLWFNGTVLQQNLRSGRQEADLHSAQVLLFLGLRYFSYLSLG
jgi:hypothetical protein